MPALRPAELQKEGEMRVLLAGESWTMHTIHQKGFDSFTTTAYAEGHHWLTRALEAGGIEIDYLPSHLANDQFPQTPEELARYEAVILSDIGSNTLLLSSETFTKSVAKPNRLESIRAYVEGGGGFVMVGGYLTFQGIDGKARYGGSPAEAALPVTMLPGDDRLEAPQGVTPAVVDADHPIVAGLPGSWPDLLGYNRLIPRPEATVIATAGDDPLIVAWQYGKGRAVAFASDCGPHWAPPAFVEWDGYARLWQQLVGWACGQG
jgi:uncharacterized membrane protein